jgi:tetratricopeptide (TPR) repeat protein
VAEDDGTHRWQRLPPRAEADADPIQAMRTAIAEIKKAPRDPEARRRLRALAADQGAWEQLALLLADEARAAAKRPEVSAAFFEELADVHENLDQPLETISAMEAVVELAPDHLEHHDRLAWLYRRAGAWQKAAGAFERVAGLARDDRARAALRAAGKLYRDNGRLEQAAATYHAIVERKPTDLDAWRALDEILSQLGRWREVARVRGELAQLSAAGVDKAALLRGQARALEQAGEVNAAAELVAEASHHAPDNISGLVDYADVLARGGQGREAADIISARVDEAVDRGAPTDDVAALRLRLAAILDDVCDDRLAAGAVLRDLLAAAPDYLPGLERLASHAAQAGDERVHADALLRYAVALPADPGRTPMIAEAARRATDAGHLTAAVRALEQASKEVPDDAVLAHELEEARTALSVTRAREAARAGDPEEAERRLRSILGSRPYSVGAAVALAELAEPAVAIDVLRETLAAAPDDAVPEDLARLVFRIAELSVEADPDEAHQLLHEAHRLDRRSLPITLALGESCFGRKLWREAAIHLGSLADHADAGKHAKAVAAGLVHAALADTRALRPANAARYYDAAVRIDPRCAKAWHALAEAAMDQGDTELAADRLEREAESTPDPADRVRLYDALGDLALDVLDDPARAEICWSRVARAGHAPVLHKLLALQRARGAGSERGATCALLAAIEPDEAHRKAFAEEAADAFAAGGDLVRARDVASELVARYPLDVDAVSCGSRIALAAGDHDNAARWLRRALSAWDAGTGDPRRADLWRRLGDAERARGNQPAALAAYQRSVAVSPESDGALAARRGIVELASTSGRDEHSSLIALVEAEQNPDDVIRWAREIATGGDVDGARAGYELARALGVKLTQLDEQFLAAHPAKSMASDEAYATVLSDAERRELVDDPADGALGELLELVGEALSLVCPDARSALERADLSSARRVASGTSAATAALYPQIANALGGPQTLLYAVERGHDLRVLLSAPPVVVIGPRLASIRAQSQSDADPTADAELRFKLGRVVELVRTHRLFAAGSTPAAFARFVAGLVHAFGRPAVVDVTVAAEADRLKSAIPLLLRRRLADRLIDVDAGFDTTAYVAACERAADRSGLLACGDISVAIAHAGGASAARHLVRLAASPRYLTARRKLRSRGKP